ncbi:AzlC family ABC transporter permease [Irregularibacter muris]|uniref:AzlC family ABC transporter permease n=1 Tax=Irregularibacter muris TaxID=1796619 RepID=A0AAE3HFR1_9FIRM|nr:AzlC family ABC transporter permease [Irregularibacter muris]MCR1899321.1 AzlC family ABC transporter permease [Irregularibacter muris]
MARKLAQKEEIKKGLVDGLPIVIGYIPIAMAFGILSKTSGIGFLDSFLFSVMVFAGASQFMALNLLNAGVGLGEIILTTLLVNFRHFLMSASLAGRIPKCGKKWLPLLAFGITDEAFSVISFKEGELSREYILTLQMISYLSWVGGTVLGYLLGAVLPETIQASMGVGLYAMFVAILIPEAKKSKKIAFLAILSGMVNTLLSYLEILPQGWNIVLSILLVSLIGVYLFERKEASYE